MTRRTLISLVMSVVGVAIAVVALMGVMRSGEGMVRSTQDVAGIPVTLLQPEGVGSQRPAVVMLHGFAASSVIMEPLAHTLVRAGYVVALPDQRGHGNSTSSLGSSTDRENLQADLATVVGWLAMQPGVDADRLGLVGHSMGAGAVTEYAMTQPPGVQGTVAISLPDAIDSGTRPRNLQLLFGANEPARFLDAAGEQLRLIEPSAEVGPVYGDVALGTGLQAQQIPVVEHITIVWSDSTATAMLTWLGVALDIEGPFDAQVDPAWLWLLLLLGAAGIVVIPLASVLYGRGNRRGLAATVRGWHALALTAVGALGASVVLAVVPDDWTEIVPVAVGGYLAAWFALLATVIAGSLRILPTYVRRDFQPAPGRDLWASIAFALLVTLILVGATRLTWAAAAFVGPRWWVTIVLAAVLVAYFYADAVLISRPGLLRRIGVLVGNRVIVAGALIAAVSLLGAPGILTLLVPVIALLFAVLGYFATVATMHTPLRIAPALVQGLPLAAIIGSGFPLQ